MRNPFQLLVNAILGTVSQDMGIDLGTANTLVALAGRGVIINEPTVVAIDKNSSKTLAIGEAAKKMVGRTPASVVAIRPLRDGVISDADTTKRMLQYFIRQAHPNSWYANPRPRVVIGIPSAATEVEKRAVRQSAYESGAREAFTIEEPLAAAIGCNLPVTEPGGTMCVDIGGGTAEAAVISLGEMVVSSSTNAAGDAMDEAIISYLREQHGLVVGIRSAESLKIDAGSAIALSEEFTADVRGRDIASGLPRSVPISTEELRVALSPVVADIVTMVQTTLQQAPPQLIADLMTNGIALVGGGSLLKGLDERLSTSTKFNVYVAQDPLLAVAKGCAAALSEASTLRLISSKDSLRKLPE